MRSRALSRPSAPAETPTERSKAATRTAAGPDGTYDVGSGAWGSAPFGEASSHGGRDEGGSAVTGSTQGFQSAAPSSSQGARAAPASCGAASSSPSQGGRADARSAGACSAGSGCGATRGPAGSGLPRRGSAGAKGEP